MRTFQAVIVILVGAALADAQPPLTSAEQVLERYKQALGGPDAIKKVQSVTMHGEVEVPGMTKIVKFVS